MIIDERLFTFINSFDKGNSAFLDELEQEAKRDYVPIIRTDMQNLLRFLLRLKRPLNILEVGTAVGFSALLMAEATTEDCQITTIENYEKRIPIARANFQRAGMEHRITLLEGDATEILKELEGPYDFIFMDAAKGQYMEFLAVADRILKPGGLLVADNVLINGWVVNLNYPRHRQKTMVYRMKEFLEQFKNNPAYQCSVVPLGDGVALIRKCES